MESLAALSDSISAMMGLDGVMDDVKDVAILGVGAAAGLAIENILFSKVFPMIPVVKDYVTGPSASAYARPVIDMMLAVAGGVALGRFVHRGLGAGFGAAVFGKGAVDLIRAVSPDIANTLGLKGLGATRQELLLGFKARNITATPGMSVGRALRGLGAYGTVGVRAATKVPGAGWQGLSDLSAATLT